MADARLPGGEDRAKHLAAALSASSLIIHNPPDFPHNADIIGLCSVKPTDISPDKYGWMVRDFLAFKTLLHKVGRRDAQTWLSSVDMSEAIAENGGFFEHTGKRVTDANDAMIQVVLSTGELIGKFLDTVAAQAMNAKKNNSALVVLVFGPVTPEQDLCFDLQGQVVITTEQIRKAARSSDDKDLPLVLLTPSMFTAGWQVNLALCGATSATAENALNMISMCCGSTVAIDVVGGFTTRATPLLDEKERSRAQYDDLTPFEPSKEQKGLKELFRQLIFNALGQRMCKLSLKHSFDFSEKDDAWNVYGERIGRQLDFWKQHWGSNETSSEPRLEGFLFLGEAFGGSKLSQIFHLKYLAEMELVTSKDDRFNRVTQQANDTLSLFLKESNISEQDLKAAFDIIEFRAARITTVGVIAKYFDLPRPGGSMCRFWSDRTPGKTERLCVSLIRDLLTNKELPRSADRTSAMDLVFWRPLSWLGAAIAAKFEDKSEDEVKAFISENVSQVLKAIRQAQENILMKDETLKIVGMNWLEAIGMKGERSTETTPVKGLATATQDKTIAGGLANSMHTVARGQMSMGRIKTAQSPGREVPTQLNPKATQFDPSTSPSADIAPQEISASPSVKKNASTGAPNIVVKNGDASFSAKHAHLHASESPMIKPVKSDLNKPVKNGETKPSSEPVHALDPKVVAETIHRKFPPASQTDTPLLDVAWVAEVLAHLAQLQTTTAKKATPPHPTGAKMEHQGSGEGTCAPPRKIGSNLAKIIDLSTSNQMKSKTPSDGATKTKPSSNPEAFGMKESSISARSRSSADPDVAIDMKKSLMGEKQEAAMKQQLEENCEGAARKERHHLKLEYTTKAPLTEPLMKGSAEGLNKRHLEDDRENPAHKENLRLELDSKHQPPRKDNAAPVEGQWEINTWVQPKKREPNWAKVNW